MTEGRPWIDAWILSLSNIDQSGGSFWTRLEFHVNWYLMEKDVQSY